MYHNRMLTHQGSSHPELAGAFFVLPAFLVLFARTTIIAAALVFALELVGAIVPKGRSRNKKNSGVS